MKLSKEEKIKYVKAYNAGEVIKTPYGFNDRRTFLSSLHGWVKRFNEEGEKGLDRRPKKNVSEAEKIAVVKRVINGERNTDISKETGISSSSISIWCKEYSNSIQNGIECNSIEENTMAKEKDTNSNETKEEKIIRLEKENEQLKTEVAVLKKSIALKVMKARQQKKRK